MEKKYVLKKKVIIFLMLLVALIIGIIILVMGMNKDKEATKANVSEIKASYSLLSKEIGEYNKIREESTEIFANLLLEKYESEHEKVTLLVDKYNGVMDNIDNYIGKINGKCNNKYRDEEVNKICSNYKQIYEKLVNLYVGDLKKYNEVVTEYNEYKKTELALFTMLHGDYIDYDNNSIFEGRDSSEEN